MEINYPIAALVILLAILLVVYLAKKNLRDKKKFEKDIIRSEIKPDKHSDEKT